MASGRSSRVVFVLCFLIRAENNSGSRRGRTEREAARQLWTDGGWVFASRTGAPLNPNTDYHEWKALLQVAGLRTAPLHEARHTAATVLLILGVPERLVVGIVGWSSTGMAARYQHITDPIRQDVAKGARRRAIGVGRRRRPGRRVTRMRLEINKGPVDSDRPVRFGCSRWRRIRDSNS
jgi:integrase